MVENFVFASDHETGDFTSPNDNFNTVISILMPLFTFLPFKVKYFAPVANVSSNVFLSDVKAMFLNDSGVRQYIAGYAVANV